CQSLECGRRRGPAAGKERRRRTRARPEIHVARRGEVVYTPRGKEIVLRDPDALAKGLDVQVFCKRERNRILEVHQLSLILIYAYAIRRHIRRKLDLLSDLTRRLLLLLRSGLGFLSSRGRRDGSNVLLLSRSR